MNKKITGILVSILFFGASVIPSIAGYNSEVDKKDINNLFKQHIQKGVITNNGWIEQDKLLALDGYSFDYFGYSVDVYNDTIIIGVIWDDDNGENSGSAYIFTRSGSNWTQQAKLLASDGQAGDYFGFSVALYEDTAIIGANRDDDNGVDSGSAYIFTQTGSVWTQQAKLLASDGEADARFGQSVSIYEDTVIIGAYRDDSTIGSAYVFIRNDTSWIEQQKLKALDGETGDYFGISISIDNDYTIIGAIYDNASGVTSGSAYIFTRSGSIWTQQAKLIPPDGEKTDEFGNSVDIYGDTVIIGAPQDDDNGENSGSTYIYTRTGSVWTQQAKLLASDGEEGDLLGTSVSLYDETAIIGAPWDDYNEDRTGSVYVFNRSGSVWTQEIKLLASDGEENDWFGNRVSYNKDTAALGVMYDDDNGNDSGSAYVFIKESENQPPNPPTITGPTNGKVGEEYCWNISSVDPDGDDLMYLVDWGNGDTTETECYPSGMEVEVCHTYTSQGTYTIKVKAKECPDGLIGPEATFTITITKKNKSINSPFLKLFQSHPNLFLIIRQLIGLI
jgi:predicted amidohydrolase